jgi:hypothetical protein
MICLVDRQNSREVARLHFTARIEGAHSDRAVSASKKDGLVVPLPPSATARCASTEDQQAPSPLLLRKDRF